MVISIIPGLHGQVFESAEIFRKFLLLLLKSEKKRRKNNL
jgi:hypothetical protein